MEDSAQDTEPRGDYYQQEITLLKVTKSSSHHKRVVRMRKYENQCTGSWPQVAIAGCMCAGHTEGRATGAAQPPRPSSTANHGSKLKTKPQSAT